MSAKQYLSTSLAGLSLALLMSVWAPSASAAPALFTCECACVDGTPELACNSVTATAQQEADCSAMMCAPVADAGSTGDTGSTDAGTDSGSTDSGSTGSEAPAGDSGEQVDPPMAADGSGPMTGLDCRMRNVYRPDLGRYKRHKVCRLSPEKRAELRERFAEISERHESNMDRLRAKHERRAARRAERRAERGASADD
jgi:hypothetical protein